MLVPEFEKFVCFKPGQQVTLRSGARNQRTRSRANEKHRNQVILKQYRLIAEFPGNRERHCRPLRVLFISTSFSLYQLTLTFSHKIKCSFTKLNFIFQICFHTSKKICPAFGISYNPFKVIFV